MLWKTLKVDEASASKLSKALKLSEGMGRLLVRLGLTGAEAAEAFLRPRLADLDCPFAITHLEEAVRRIERAIDAKEDVVVFGDYDVDGVTGVVQLVGMLRRFDLSPRFCVPRRLEEGYGLSREAMDRAFDGKVPDLFVALDCGTNAKEPIAYLREQGVDVIIVDHHQSKEDPSAWQETESGHCILVNPHVNDGKAVPWCDLCTAGLVFKLLHGLLKRRRAACDPRAESIRLKDFLDLVAMGTIADLVPLRGENRILSWFGLRHLKANARPGVRALIEVSGIRRGQTIIGADVSFKLAPRINASGRLADAVLPIELLLNEGDDACRKMALELDAMNRERRALEQNIAKEAEARAGRELEGKPGIVLYGKDWHPGIVGIVASRVSRAFHKPCVILGAEGDMAKGSGRSVGDVNLVEVFQRCADLLVHWGGHPKAVGVSLKASDVDAFAERFTNGVGELFPSGLPEPRLEIATWLEPEDLSEAFLEELDRLHPFGQGNDDPVLGIRGVTFEEAPQAFGKGHLRFKLPSSVNRGESIAGMVWRPGTFPEVGHTVDLAVRFSWNHRARHRHPQVTLVDWKSSECE